MKSYSVAFKWKLLSSFSLWYCLLCLTRWLQFWLCGRHPKVSLFKWKLSGSTYNGSVGFPVQNKPRDFFFILSALGSERINVLANDMITCRSYADLDECAQFNPCKNGARCVNQHGGFRCVCPAGITGMLCDLGTIQCLGTSQERLLADCENNYVMCISKMLEFFIPACSLHCRQGQTFISTCQEQNQKQSKKKKERLVFAVFASFIVLGRHCLYISALDETCLFPTLEPVTWFAVLGTVGIFSALDTIPVSPCLTLKPVLCFPIFFAPEALGTGCRFCRGWYRLHVFTRLRLIFPCFALVTRVALSLYWFSFGWFRWPQIQPKDCILLIAALIDQSKNAEAVRKLTRFRDMPC